MSNTEAQISTAQITTDEPAAEYVPPSPPPRVPLTSDEPTTLAEVFLRAARTHNKPDALNYKRDGAWHAISSAEMVEHARYIAYGLYALGLRRGDRAALLSESCPEWVLTDAGCQFAGLVDVPIYSTQAPPQVRYILDDSGARLLFVRDRAAYDRISDAIKDCAALAHVVFFAAAGAKEAGALTLAELEARGRELATAQPDLLAEITRAIQPDDLATIIYTSGTTGEPKGVMLTQSNLVS
ncbi:MAG TPA: AMP-binding protein, partial [Pyrinomonadaceae bacterium]|nr:AMP-binding protein [Pyrinomonadaceae bacterium]